MPILQLCEVQAPYPPLEGGVAAPQLFALQNHAGLRRAVLKGRKAGQSSPLAGFQESPRLTEETEALGTVGSGSVLSLGMYPTSSISIDSS